MIQILLLVAVSYAQVVSSPQSTRVTQVCQTYYFWTGQSCQPCQTTVANGVCKCTSATDCTPVCNSGYFLSGTTCVKSPAKPDPNCLTYGVGTKAIECYSCNPGYVLVGNVCLNSGNCDTLDLTSTICKTCKAGFYFNWVNSASGTLNNYNSLTYYQVAGNIQCSPCMTGCSSCPSSHTCATCSDGYFWQVGTTNQAGSCAACSANCKTCNSSTYCTSCFNNYYLNNNNNNNECQACSVANCAQCGNSTSVCATCRTGYNLTNNGASCTVPAVAVACSVNGCDPSSCNAATCTKCLPGYSTVNNNACYACSTGCQSCSRLGTTTSTTCDTCYDTFYRVVGATSSDAATCNQCSSANSSYLRCQGASDTPAASGTTVVPTQCANNYFLVSGQCVAYSTSPANTCLVIQNHNQKTILAASSATSCSACLTGYTQIVDKQCASCPATVQGCQTCENKNGAIACTACVAGRFLASSTACTQCSTGCTACTSATACTACSPVGYYLNNAACTACSVSGCITCTANGCTACQSGYFLQTTNSVQTCNKCPAECATCNAPGNLCATCQTGYVMQSNGCVLLSSANCAVSGSSGCTLCAYGFYLQDGICFQTVSQLAGFVQHQNNAASSNPAGTPTNSTTSSYSLIAVVSMFITMLFM